MRGVNIGGGGGGGGAWSMTKVFRSTFYDLC